MRYQVNTRHRDSVIPVIELAPGEKGEIKYVAMYADQSVIHVSSATIREPSRELVLLLHDSSLKPKRLSDFDDVQLNKLSQMYKLPLADLHALRGMELEYRETNGKYRSELKIEHHSWQF